MADEFIDARFIIAKWHYPVVSNTLKSGRYIQGFSSLPESGRRHSGRLLNVLFMFSSTIVSREMTPTSLLMSIIFPIEIFI